MPLLFFIVWFTMMLAPLVGILDERSDQKISAKGFRVICYWWFFWLAVLPCILGPHFIPNYVAPESSAAIRTIGTLPVAFMLFPNFGVYTLVGNFPLAAALLFFLLIPIGFIFYRQLVRRARDAGFGKNLVFIGVLPLLNCFLIIFFMIKRSVDVKDGKIDAEET